MAHLSNYKDPMPNKFENKGMPLIPPPTKIVEAYGLGKCPKLVAQICGSDLDVRINALAVLCDEFRNPYSIEGCAREGVIPNLANMIVDPDYNTRVRASKALFLAASDANGYASILLEKMSVFPRLVQGVSDPSEVVRENIYGCILSTTRTDEGVEACVKYGVTNAFTKVLSDEVDTLKPLLLKTLHKLVGSETGLLQAINDNAVGICINLLTRNPDSNLESENIVIAEAAKTLGYICFDGRGKKQALEKGAVEKLLSLLSENDLPQLVKISVTTAMMAITITNDGKIKVHLNEGIEVIRNLLYDTNRAVLLNALKIISNLAVYPKNREAFVNDSTCTVKLRKLTKVEDSLISKHADIALAAVNWTP